jgi:hypothetical protein
VSSQVKGVSGKAASSCLAVVADLDHQQSVGPEVFARSGEDGTRQIEAIVAAGQRQFGFASILGG